MTYFEKGDSPSFSFRCTTITSSYSSTVPSFFIVVNCLQRMSLPRQSNKPVCGILGYISVLGDHNTRIIELNLFTMINTYNTRQ